MPETRDAIVVSEPGFFDAPIPGGVQVCTAEYLELVVAAGFTVHRHPVTGARDLLTRLRGRLGLDVYDRYDEDRHAREIAAAAASHGARLVLLNQIDLAGLAPALRRHLDPRTVLALLSHGNGSGDLLHEAALTPMGPLTRARTLWRLGGHLWRESLLYRRDLDLVVCLSETEREIDRWLGAARLLVVPRLLREAPLARQPVPGRVGVVGTMDHLPNLRGVEWLAEALADRSIPDLRLRVVGGGGAAAGALARRFGFLEWLGPLDDAALGAEAATWSLFVNPLFWYGRGASTKLAMAIGWGLPVVTTPAGRRGYTWREGELPQPATPAAFADVVAALLADPARLEALAGEVRRAGRSGPSIETLAAAFRDAVDAATAARC